MTTILIGDVHGCAVELEKLLEKIPPASGSEVIFLGDLVNKGPDPARVVRLVRERGALCLRGNHENAHLDWQPGRIAPKAEYVRTRDFMGPKAYDEYLDFARSMPRHVETDEWIAVHGAFRPGIPWSDQPPELLSGDIEIDLSWKDTLDVRKPVVVGHKRYSANPAEPFIRPGRFYALDTACVYGGALTALALPSGTIWQVPAERNYSLNR